MDSIIGVLIAALVMAFGIRTYTDYETSSIAATLAATTATEWVQVNSAATNYIQANATAIEAQATSSTPVTITIAMLTAPSVALLPASFSAINPYGQTWKVQVLQPTPGNLQALVLTTGGESLRDKSVARIANLVGATGGFIPMDDSGLYPTGYAYGVANSWKVATTGYSVSPGELAALITVGNGQTQNPFVYRNAVPGQPQLNAMTTPLIMTSQQAAGSACTAAQNGAIAMDNSTGAGQSQTILTCNGTLWQADGCVATGADLNLIESGAHCYNGVGNPNSPAGSDWFFMQESRHINMGNDYATQRVTGMTGASAGKVWQRNQQSGAPGAGWSAWNQVEDPHVAIWDQPTEGGVIQLTGANGVTSYVENTNGTFRLVNSAWTQQLFAVDQSGNVSAAGTSSAQQFIAPGGDGMQIGSSYYYGDTANSAIRQNGGVYIQNASGTNTVAYVDQNGNVNSTGYVNPGHIAASGAPCAAVGSIAADWQGNLYVCN